MIYLTLKLDDAILGTYHFDEVDVVTIGRSSANDIVISDSSVSGNHAKIEFVDGGYLVSDLQSKNGVFVNKKFVSSHWLKNGDVITIGKHVIEFGYKMAGEAKVSDQTMVLDMDSYKEMRAESFLRVALGEGAAELQGKIVFISGIASGSLDLTKKVTTIGKDAESDIVVQGFLIGKTAAAISKRVDGYYLSYVGGFVRPKVNGKTVKDSILLRDSAIINIGDVTMQFVATK